MDITLVDLTKILAQTGPIGLVIFFWWYDNRRIWIVFDQHKKDLEDQRIQFANKTASIMEQYRADMAEQREMYRANVSLCRDFSTVADDLRNIVTMNIQKMTQLDDAIRQNQFCPMIRIDRVKKMPGMEREA